MKSGIRTKLKASPVIGKFFCLAYKIPEPVSEYRFKNDRQWRFDFAYVAEKIAIEVEGGVWSRGRHTRGAGYIKDLDKYNRAQLDGWIVLRCTPQTLSEIVPLIKEALKIRRMK